VTKILFHSAFLFCLGSLLTACGDGNRQENVSQSALFRDGASESGLNFVHFTGATERFFLPESVGAGAALLDYDGDGDLDVYLLQGIRLDPDPQARILFPLPSTHPHGHRLMRNRLVPDGDLHFSDVSTEAGVDFLGYGMGVAVGDYDNDGDPDLYVTHFGSNLLLRNEGDGQFEDVTSAMSADDPRWSTSATFFDYDLDGDLDLFVTNYVDFNLKNHRRCNDPVSGRHDYCGPSSYRPQPDRLMRNDGDTFTDVTAAAGLTSAYGPGLGVVAADFNGDGWPDLYVANDGKANQLWMNRGDGLFVEDALMAGAALNQAGAAEASMGVTAGDMDGDGDEDLFLTHLDGETNTLYLNRGDGSFDDATNGRGLSGASLSYTGFGTRWVDWDNDGDLDLFIANGAVTVDPRRKDDPYPYGQPNQLYRNEAGHFTHVSSDGGEDLALPLVSRGTAFGDIDNDGDIDILVSNNNGPVQLLLNRGVPGQHWLRLRLVGTLSNRDGTGARVALLRPGRPPVWRRVHSDGSYLSASETCVHFGLGADNTFEGVGVVWPNGRRELWRSLPINAQSELKEGSGSPWVPEEDKDLM
jgi:hypothetical protein